MTRQRWAVAVALLAAVVLGAAGAVAAFPRAQVADSGTAAQLDRIDGNAYGACVNAAGSSAARLARCSAPPTNPPTSSAPATTTPPSPPPSGGCAWPACFPTATTHNLFRCGQYSVRINDTGTGVSGNHPGVTVEVRDNTVTAGSYVNGPAECGHGVTWNGTDGVKWSGNVLDNGQAIPTPCV